MTKPKPDQKGDHHVVLYHVLPLGGRLAWPPAKHVATATATAIERINRQALALGIERPHLRNGDSIANLNTLIYVLINLRTLQRVRTRQASGASPGRAALAN